MEAILIEPRDEDEMQILKTIIDTYNGVES